MTVFHIHGIIDRQLEPRPIIFSGTSYSEYGRYYLNRGARKFAEVYDRSDTILCIGFSGSDANFRRMARQLKELKESPLFREKEKKLYIARAWKDDADRYGFKTKGAGTGADDAEIRKAYGCLRSFISMVHQYYKNEFDVNIYWVEDFSRLADWVRSVAGGGKK